MPSNSEPEPYDLLNDPNLNGLFHVIFDTWTPRPHFIIKPKDPTVVDLDFAKMIEEQTQLQTLMEADESKDPTVVDPDVAKMIPKQTQLQTLMKAVESMRQVMSGYGIKSSILSFHRGSWHTKEKRKEENQESWHTKEKRKEENQESWHTKEKRKEENQESWHTKEKRKEENQESWHTKDKRTFHAHICVRDIDVKLYEKVFEKNKSKIPESAWPNRRRGNVAQKWKVNNDPDSYLQNVRDYKMNQMKKYFPNGKSKIEEPKAVLPTVGEEGITQVMHPSHPKIGFVAKRDEIEQKISLTAIEKFAQDLGLTDLENEYQGCHVCLYLGPVPEEEGWSQTGEDEEVLGYILIDWRLFYQLCLEERRQNWFSDFKESDFVCLT